jgi:hypothetical protein
MEITPCSRVTQQKVISHLNKRIEYMYLLYSGWTYLQAPGPATSKGRVSNIILLPQLLENLFFTGKGLSMLIKGE